jgi:uncharacterized coiled-coil DUF342 family protein
MNKNELFGRLVKNVKSAIQPGGDMPVAETGDEVGEQMQAICELAKSIAQRHADLTQDVNDLSAKVSVLFEGVQALRADMPKEKPKADEKPKAEEKPKAKEKEEPKEEPKSEEKAEPEANATDDEDAK